MGGYGSGRQYGKPLADSAKRIDLAWMVRQGLAKPGCVRTGNLSWTFNGEPAGNISFTCNMCDPDDATLILKFSASTCATDKRDYVQRIRLSHTVPHFGGRRWWMHCPINGERVGKLYCPSGYATFASREARGIGYHSQRIAARDKPFEALFRLQKRLGCREGWEQPIRRPKGMWQRTYKKLEDEYWRLDAECSAAMAGVMARLR